MTPSAIAVAAVPSALTALPSAGTLLLPLTGPAPTLPAPLLLSSLYPAGTATLAPVPAMMPASSATTSPTVPPTAANSAVHLHRGTVPVRHSGISGSNTSTSAQMSRGFARAPTEPQAVESFAAALRAEQWRLDQGSLLISEAALKAVLPAQSNSQLSISGSSSSGGGTQEDARHLHAWGRLVLAMCNEAALADTVRALPLAPPGLDVSAPPPKLLAHRQGRAHDGVIAKLAMTTAYGLSGQRLGMGTAAGGVAGVAMAEDAHVAMAYDDIEEFDQLVRSLLRAHEDELQLELSEELLRLMVREVVEEHQRVGHTRRLGL